MKKNGESSYYENNKYQKSGTSTIRSVNELFNVLLNENKEENKNYIYKSSSENLRENLTNSFNKSNSSNFDKNEALLEKHFREPSLTTLPIFQESDSEEILDSGNINSDNDSEYSSDIGNEEDFNEADINEMLNSKPKLAKREEYIRYLNSMGTSMLGISEEITISENEKHKSKGKIYDIILIEISKKVNKYWVPKTKKEIYKVFRFVYAHLELNHKC